MALAYTVRDRLLERYHHDGGRDCRAGLAGQGGRVPVGRVPDRAASRQQPDQPRHLGGGARQALAKVGLDLASLLEQEEEPGLGNGGLGRLAACYMDSLATLDVPAIGYGIRYEFGIFDQAIRDGWQVELTDKWLRFGNPWEIVALGDRVRRAARRAHRALPATSRAATASAGIPRRVVKGVAYDTPVPGYRVPTTNLLRLWKAEATESFDFEAFNVGDYYGAVDQKVASETISKVLYPNDEPEAGKQLRLEQQYFFVSCSLQDMLRLHLMRGKRARRASTRAGRCS